jgi:hypothetical protein
MLPGELRGRMLQFGTMSADGRPATFICSRATSHDFRSSAHSDLSIANV